MEWDGGGSGDECWTMPLRRGLDTVRWGCRPGRMVKVLKVLATTVRTPTVKKSLI